MELDFGPVLDSAPFLARGLLMTLQVTAFSMGLALVLGLAMALLRLAPFAPIRGLAVAYIDFFRGLPQLVFLIWMYFGVSVAFGLRLSPIAAAVACLAIQEAAHVAEIYRSGLSSIPGGQKEAAASLGLSSVQAFRHVLFPQALRVALPAIGNDFIAMLKGSSLVSVLGVQELMRVSQARANYFFRPFEFLTTAAVIYVVLALGLGRVFAAAERKLA